VQYLRLSDPGTYRGADSRAYSQTNCGADGRANT
jgi:hypothetical protein